MTATGFSILYIVAHATTPCWFERRLEIATAGGGFGILVVPTVAARIIDLLEWYEAYLTIMLGFLVVILITAGLVADYSTSVGIDANAEFPNGQPSLPAADIGHSLNAVADMFRRPSFVFVFAGYVMLSAPAYMIPPPS